MKTLKVNLDRRKDLSYEIHIGGDILDRMAMILARNGWAERYIIITDTRIDALHGDKVQSALEKCDLRVDRILIEPGEASKKIETILAVTERMLALGADRHTALIALGGGVVGDLAGFAASIYMRGIPVIQVPTTLLAQVDSSIGGKTGVDTAAGKNLLGTFHQPKAVFIDTAFLATLPDAEFRNGLAEVIKYGAIEDPDLLNDVESAASAGTLREPAFLERIIEAACRIKKGIVELDDRELGLRRILNFGHTVGHAVEAASGYSLTHGEAVAIGMVAAAALSERRHNLPADEGRRIGSVIQTAGLPGRIPKELEMDEIRARMATDKKKQGDAVHFVLLRKLGVPFIDGGIPAELVHETLEALRA
jgi:3-dehydroquinate synthase